MSCSEFYLYKTHLKKLSNILSVAFLQSKYSYYIELKYKPNKGRIKLYIKSEV